MTNNSFNPFAWLLAPNMKDKINRCIKFKNWQQKRDDKRLAKLKEKMEHEYKLYELRNIQRSHELNGLNEQFQYVCDNCAPTVGDIPLSVK